MADIVYKVEYDDETPFEIPKPDVRAIRARGTQPDRIGFVTTRETAEYLAKEKKRVALHRDGRDPFGKNSMSDPYIVPVEGKKPVKFFKVEKAGKKRAFHLTCGQVGINDKEFKAWGTKFGKRPSVPLP